MFALNTTLRLVLILFFSYEPIIYPGVNIKYFYNTCYNNGICQCSKLCTGKGNSNGNGNCKRITIAVFKSGKVIITGGQNRDQIERSYNFITTFINSNKDKYVLK